MPDIRPERYLDLLPYLIVMRQRVLPLKQGKFIFPVHLLIGRDHALLQPEGIKSSRRLFHIRPFVQGVADTGQKSRHKAQPRRQMHIVKLPDQGG